MTIERPMFPPRAESLDSFPSHPATGQPEMGTRISDSPRPIAGQPNVITFPSKMPASNLRAVDFPVTGRQRAGRQRNPLRHYHSQAATAVTIAGKLHRGEPLRAEDWIDELKWLGDGAKAARFLADELERIVGEEC